MLGSVVMGLFCTFFTPIQVVIIVEGRMATMTFKTDDSLYCVLRDQIYSGRTFSFIVKFNSKMTLLVGFAYKFLSSSLFDLGAAASA